MKYSIVCIMGVLCFGSILAQKPGFGVQTGLNMAKWKLGESPSEVENRFRVGLLAGVNAEFPLKENMRMRTELQLAAFGTTLSNGAGKGRYKTSYILAPVLVQYNFDKGISAYLGPQLGIRIGAKSILDGEKYDSKEKVKTCDIFLVIGGQYMLNKDLGLGLRYQHGLRNIENGANTTLHNRSLSIIASYRLQNNVIDKIRQIF